MPATIAIAARAPGDTTRQTVARTYKTGSPYFIAHHSIDGAGEPLQTWTVTHAKTGYAIAQGLISLGVARSLANCVAKIEGVDWKIAEVAEIQRAPKCAVKLIFQAIKRADWGLTNHG